MIAFIGKLWLLLPTEQQGHIELDELAIECIDKGAVEVGRGVRDVHEVAGKVHCHNVQIASLLLRGDVLNRG